MPGIPRAPKSRVQKLEIENFKSYRGRQDIGPFHSFTAIIGPNGSGKSNIMDAVSFVLGVKGAQIRGSLKELLHSYIEGRETVRPETGYVRLILETEGQEDTVFQRSIVQTRGTEAFASQYSINGRTVTWAAYEDKLKTFGILVKVRNFLVFQGDIEAVASKQPAELTKLFESISGSEAFKADYERLDAERRAAQEKLAFVQSKKKNTAAEKRQKKEQKVEAERHMRLQQQLEASKSSYYLWQLYHGQLDAQDTEGELEAQQDELRAAAKLLKDAETAVREKKKEIAGLSKARTQLEQKAKKRRREVDKHNPEQTRIRVEVDRLHSRIREEEKKLAEGESQQAASQKKIKDFEARGAQLKKEQEQREAAPSATQRMLTGSLQTEYNRRSELVKTSTRKARNELEAHQMLQNTDKRALEDAEASLASIQNQIQKVHAAREAQAQRQASKREDLATAEADLASLEDTISKQTVEGRAGQSDMHAIEEKILQIDDKLRDFKASEKDLDKEASKQSLLEEMKEVIKGVHGRIATLGKVTQQSYSLALAITMGPAMESVVVDSEEEARKCIDFLKQKRAPPMTFVPLRSVKASAPHERLRTLGGTAKLAIDLIDFPAHLERAFFHACGNTIVCNSEKEAKELAFGTRGERHKVVTKAGLLIARSGAMTGGGAGQAAAKAARLNQAQYQQMKQEKVELQKRLAEMPGNEERRRSEQARRVNEANQLRAKVQALQKDLSAGQEDRNQGQQLEPLLLKKEELEAEIVEVQQEISVRQKTLDTIQQRIDTLTDDLYADLSRQVGVDSLRVYLQYNADELQKLEGARVRHGVEIAKIDSGIKYERQRPFAGQIAAFKANLAKHKARLAELEGEASQLQAATAEVESRASAEADELTALKAQIDAREAELKELRSRESEHVAAGKKVHQETKRLEAALEAIAMKQSEIVKTAQLEQVELPRHEGEDAEQMETDDAARDAARLVETLNFDGLSRQQKAARAEAERERLDSEFTSTIEEQQAALAKVLPNLKAVEQYQEAKDKDDKEKAELEEARQANRDMANDFHRIRQQRSETYMKAFDHIKEVINPIYKDLTKSNAHPMGGTAYLSMVNTEDEPFLSGVSFTAMPPSKRWRQMELLSGGEKTVAALALLFAIQSYHPSPFFVLDEVDAALDASNVAKVASYIREKTRTEEGLEQFQAIVISLKDYFFSKADAVVGVTKHPHHGCSQTLTLDLNQFGPPEQ